MESFYNKNVKVIIFLMYKFLDIMEIKVLGYNFKQKNINNVKF